MKTYTSSISFCRHCQYYVPEGRRGGSCTKLNVSVKSRWKACNLAIPPFTPAWEGLGDIMLWQQRALEMQESSGLNCADKSYMNADKSHMNKEDFEAVEVPQPAPITMTARASSVWM